MNNGMHFRVLASTTPLSSGRANIRDFVRRLPWRKRYKSSRPDLWFRFRLTMEMYHGLPLVGFCSDHIAFRHGPRCVYGPPTTLQLVSRISFPLVLSLLLTFYIVPSSRACPISPRLPFLPVLSFTPCLFVFVSPSFSSAHTCELICWWSSRIWFCPARIPFLF